MPTSKPDLSALKERFREASAEEIVAFASAEYGTEAKLSTAFGAEGVVLLDMISNVAPQTPVFTIDTGRQFDETYEVMERCRERYDLGIEVYFPQREPVEELLQLHGPYSFRRSVENRQRCCHIRKVEPLGRALTGARAWLTGLRMEQAVTRQEVDVVMWDERYQVVKLNPLFRWTAEQVWNYIRRHDVPYNTLHERGYPSVGCAPCTRPLTPGEHIRAGRWWWEQPEHRECGLHPDRPGRP